MRTNRTAFPATSFSSADYTKPASDSSVQQVFENLQKTRTNVTISKVKCTKQVVQSSPAETVVVMDAEPEPESENVKLDTFIDGQSSDVDANDDTNQIIEYYEEYLNDFDQSNNEDELESIDKESDNSPPPSAETTAVTSSLVVQPVTATAKSSNKPTVVKMLCEASFVCMTCKINVNTFEELRIHMKTNVACKKIHTTCDVCGKCCDSKKSLYQHSLTHKQKSAYVCEECGKVYTNRFNLENHKS